MAKRKVSPRRACHAGSSVLAKSAGGSRDRVHSQVASVPNGPSLTARCETRVTGIACSRYKSRRGGFPEVLVIHKQGANSRSREFFSPWRNSLNSGDQSELPIAYRRLSVLSNAPALPGAARTSGVKILRIGQLNFLNATFPPHTAHGFWPTGALYRAVALT